MQATTKVRKMTIRDDYSRTKSAKHKSQTRREQRRVKVSSRYATA